MSQNLFIALAYVALIAFSGGFAWRLGELAFDRLRRRFVGPKPQDITTAAQVFELQTRLEHADQTLRQQRAWMDQAKRDANFPQHVSFDVVWRDALNALLDQRKRLDQ